MTRAFGILGQVNCIAHVSFPQFPPNTNSDKQTKVSACLLTIPPDLVVIGVEKWRQSHEYLPHDLVVVTSAFSAR